MLVELESLSHALARARQYDAAPPHAVRWACRGIPQARGSRDSLLQRAWAVLQAGPALTADLARDVLGLDGHPGAASAAVFALLGGDERFLVDGEGRWSLRDGVARAPGSPLSRLSYAVVDVETTGGSYEGGHRMTEVAVVRCGAGPWRTPSTRWCNPGAPSPP